MLRYILAFALVTATICTVGQTVTNLHGSYRNGQVFLTWKNITTDTYYKVYRSTNLITNSNQLALCEYLGYTDQHSAEDHNLSTHDGITKYLRIDSNGAPLMRNTGLFVATTLINDNYYYAVTTLVNGVENKIIMPGINSLSVSIAEKVTTTLPVFQEQRSLGNKPVDIYTTFFSTKRGIPQTLENQAGFMAFDFALNHLLPDGELHPLKLLFHGGGEDFLWNVQVTSGNEINLGLEETLPNEESNGWMGDNENYNIFNITPENTPPVTGINYNFSQQIISQTIDWATSHLPVDLNRIYLQGTSNGAGGAFLYAITYPEKIAAVKLTVPSFNYSFLSDYDPSCSLNTGNKNRNYGNVQFGTVATNLMSNLGIHFYDAVNGGWMIHTYREKDYPVIFAINGKHDDMVGWTEKPIYYDLVKANHTGGYYFWDQRDHSGTNLTWSDVSFDLFRYALNRSFPAFANCSNDENYGIGNDATGAEFGTVNGSLDWNENSIEDDAGTWRVSIFVRDLKKFNGQNVGYPDSCIADVTPRRLQQFHVTAGMILNWTVSHKNKIIQSGSQIYSGGIIVIPKVKIFKDSSVLELSTGSELTYYFRDKDGDGYGDPEIFVEAQIPPPGYVADNTDCNDSNAAISPAAADVCNGIDDNCNGQTDENAITATVTPSGPASACSDTPLVLTANKGSGILYQWYRDNIPIAGASFQTYSAKKSASYYVHESNIFSCTSNSQTVMVTMIPGPSAIITPLGNLDICQTGSVDLQANAGAGYVYQWNKGNKIIAGSTNQTYTASSKGGYRVIVTNSNCSKTSNIIKVTNSCKEGLIASGSISGTLNCYPNPSDGHFSIDLKLDNELTIPASIEIVNSIDQRIYVLQVFITNGELKQVLDASLFSREGMYVVKVIAGDQIFTSRLIIQN